MPSELLRNQRLDVGCYRKACHIIGSSYKHQECAGDDDQPAAPDAKINRSNNE